MIAHLLWRRWLCSISILEVNEVKAVQQTLEQYALQLSSGDIVHLEAVK